MTIIEQLQILRRGTSHIINEEELVQRLQSGKPLKVKLGVDPTAAHVTLGWAVVFRKLRDFQRLGHTACLVIGTFTAQIGDPSGKNKTRPPLSAEEVQKYTVSVLEQVYKILDPEKTKIYYNGDWLSKMSFQDVIKLASHCTVARVLERDDFAKRLTEEKPIALHEILYPLCQAYDSVHMEPDIELGGQDQLFNHLLGRTLMGHYHQRPQMVMLCPLLVGLDGKEKMSQSLGNYIGITEAPNEMYGKTMSIPDHLILNWLELTTDVSLEDIQVYKKGMLEGQINPMEVKRRLAKELITIYHGEEDAARAEEFFTQTFSQRQQPQEAKEVAIPDELLNEERIPLAGLITALGMTKSNSEARRLIQSGAVSLDIEKIIEPKASFSKEELQNKVLRVGRHRFYKLIIKA